MSVTVEPAGRVTDRLSRLDQPIFRQCSPAQTPPSSSLIIHLRIIAFPKATPIKGQVEKVLAALGVRRHVELDLVFERLLGAGTWSAQDLVKYLVSVQGSLSKDEVEKLRRTPAFLKEGAEEGTKERFTPSQLYEPTEEMRKLGLPVIAWGTSKWRSGSDEAKVRSACFLIRAYRR